MPLDLHDMLPLWQRKLAQPLHQPELDGLTRRDVNFAVAARRERIARNGRILMQDVVRSIIVGESRIER